MAKVYVIQKPRHENQFDMEALKRLGEIVYLLPSAPNIHDQERVTKDIRHMADVLKASDPDDIFIVLGGSPLSQMLFGAAFVMANMTKINYGLFSRHQDADGRRDGGGEYRVVPIDLAYDEAPPSTDTPSLRAHA